MKLINTIAAIAMTGTLALTGCSMATQSSSTTSTTKTNTQSASEGQTATSVNDGVANLLHTAKQLNKAITAGDEANIKKTGPQLEENWKTFEDNVKSQYPDQYTQIEKYLNPAVAGSKESTINKEALSQLNNQLIDVLYQFSQKLIPVSQVKDGISKLLTTTTDLKQAINDEDQAKVKELGPKLEETWKTFEDGVKPRSADLYEKLEASLNPEVAGSQVSPLDKQTLGKLNDQLTQTLHELEQTIK
ncbi:hypothetical protein [Ectobacillus sp. sgz5001026]|uniref:hypothetical protein n=1 Tax=Ectobacillus sp. sgz5001026 TaxID=3242473 RepID=UPI0036D2BFA8